MKLTITMGDLVKILSQRDQSEIVYQWEDDGEPPAAFVDLIFGLGEMITRVDLPTE